ncbi:SEC-C metal-binding domain-containing protein [Methylobacterium oryzisoli]|uniref:SEC-C metal-binding domain-containing protein n=1 Tax=Methylobacterium oryzisoli TaxID=3385502 RepID=UPI0038926E6B
MTDQALVEELSDASYLPQAALARAVAAPDTIAEPVVALLDRAAAGESLTVPETNLVFWGVHALGAAQDGRAFAPYLRLIRRPDEDVAAVLGEDYVETLPRLVASLYDGDPTALFALVRDPQADGLVRMSVFGAIAFLTAEGRLDPAATRDLLDRFDTEGQVPDGDPAWQGWEDAIGLLGHADLAGRARDSRRSGRTPAEFSRPSAFEKMLSDAADARRRRKWFEKMSLGYLGDPAIELAFTAEPDPDAEPVEYVPPPVHNPYRDVGRNDPCPCGSGKKFKKCCYDRVASGGSQAG